MPFKGERMAYLPILYQIQETEKKYRSFEKRIKELPTQTNKNSLELLKSDLEALLETVKDRRKTISNRQKSLDLDVASCIAKLTKEEEKLYQGFGHNPRELEKIQQKVSEYRKQKEKLEEEVLKLMEADETSDAEEQSLTNRYAQTEEELWLVQQEIQDQIMELQFLKEEARMELLDLARQIPREWLDKYRKLGKKHQGIALARVVNQTCGVCHITLSDASLSAVKRGEDKLFYCENCGRILYY